MRFYVFKKLDRQGDKIIPDKTGNIVKAFQKTIGAEKYALSRFQQLELLQGTSDQKEWDLLDDYLSTQYFLEASRHFPTPYLTL